MPKRTDIFPATKLHDNLCARVHFLLAEFTANIYPRAKNLLHWRSNKQSGDICSHPVPPLAHVKGCVVDKDERRPRGNMRTRSRGWQQGLVLTWWQVRGWAPDCYHWLWFHTHSLSIALFVILLCTFVFKRRDWHWSWSWSWRCQWGAKGVNQIPVTPLKTW